MNKGNFGDYCLPKFFKVYLPDESGDDLVLPISFNSCLPKPLPETVTVRSIYGKVWKLVLRKCGSEVESFVMVNGWKSFVKDEDLKGGDFLEFEFDGSRLFNFCIYEHGTLCKRIRRSSEQSEEIKMESDSDEKNQYLDDRENPSFTLTLNPKKKSQLLIPARVIKDYDLHFPESITLVDPLVNKFGTLEKKIKIQTNGSVFVKGFGSIIRRNQVKTTDKMMCEIKKTGDNNLVQTIKIHIISG
ncbi:hypothetical protein ARALYDRAFT_919255 [Arabidopsis lyrata subsp. lyrata]|uniref:TF-B3 domain-containing protein n=1 Tax=Arabidopsis lyrata subsp. lyrata TaxID=81972 RepID=D7MT68_ARALL|nr:hypothetical protein ARALYDRAFT_919255 [Arabidopsis lyrata subsp. lyrata]